MEAEIVTDEDENEEQAHGLPTEYDEVIVSYSVGLV